MDRKIVIAENQVIQDLFNEDVEQHNFMKLSINTSRYDMESKAFGRNTPTGNR